MRSTSMPTCAPPPPRSASPRSSVSLSSAHSRASGNPQHKGCAFGAGSPAFAGTSGQSPRISLRSCGLRFRAAGLPLRGGEAVEALLLLVAERAVEALERRLHQLDGAQHRIQPLLHGGETA